MDEKKYELTENTLYINGRCLHQIRALKPIRIGVKKGDFGGWIETEDNLSQEGKCWVYDDAKVYEHARVYGDARITNKSVVYGNAEVFDSAVLHRSAIVFGNAKIYGHSDVSGRTRVHENTQIYGNASVKASMIKGGKIYGNAKINGDVMIFNNCNIYGNAFILGTGTIDNARIYENAIIEGRFYIDYNAEIKSNKDVIAISANIIDDNKYPRSSTITMYKTSVGEPYVNIRIPTDDQLVLINTSNSIPLSAFKENMDVEGKVNDKGRLLIESMIKYIED